MHAAGKISVKTYLKAIKIPFFQIRDIFIQQKGKL